MRARFVKPMTDILSRNGITQDELDTFLMMRHAEERNIEIAKRNERFPDGGSGIMTADAKAYLAEIQRDPRYAGLVEAAQIVYNMVDLQRQLMTGSGLIDDGTVSAWRKKYKYYVPLKGSAKDIGRPQTGRGFSIGGKEFKAALGRKSLAKSPSSQVVVDLTEKLVRARKNEVGRHLLQLVRDNPDAELWQVFTTENPDRYTAPVQTKDGVKAKNDAPVPMHMMPDQYLPVKEGGKIYYIKINDKDLMNAMQNVTPDVSNGVLKAMGTINRYWATINTSLNPEFGVSNFARDIQTAILNLNAEQSRDDGKIRGEAIATQVVSDVFSGKASKAIRHYDKDIAVTGEQAQWKQYYKEFLEDGAKTGFIQVKTPEQQYKEIQSLIERQNGSAKSKLLGGYDAVMGIVESVNSNVENMTRLSAYVNARKAGIDRRAATSLAKNMTVNFNRKGEYGTVLSSLYLFANASIQGTANFMRTMYGLNGDGKFRWRNLNRAQKIALGMVGVSYVLAMVNRAIAGDDDDGESFYDKVPDYVKERNIVIMKGDGKGGYWKIPMPYGYNIFSVLGTTAESISAGKTSVMSGAWNVTKAFAGSFSPIPMQDSAEPINFVAKNIAPTAFKGVLEVALNDNFYGGKIYNENSPYGVVRPDSELGRRGTSEAYKQAAKLLNTRTGGDAYTSGKIDVHPEILRYLVQMFTGGMGTFWGTKLVGSGVNLSTGAEIDAKDIPFFSKISGEYAPYEDQDRYYKRRERIRQLYLKAKEVGMQSITGKDMLKLRMYQLMKQADRELKQLRKARDFVYADNSLSVKQRDAKLKQIEKRMALIIDRFNKIYNEKVRDAEAEK